MGLWNENKKLIYAWIMNYLNDNGDTEFIRLRALICIEFGITSEKATENISTLIQAGIVDKKKIGEEVMICLSKQKNTL